MYNHGKFSVEDFLFSSRSEVNALWSEDRQRSLATGDEEIDRVFSFVGQSIASPAKDKEEE